MYLQYTLVLAAHRNFPRTSPGPCLWNVGEVGVRLLVIRAEHQPLKSG